MMSKVDSRKKIGENSGSGRLLNDIEAINKALYLDKNKPRSTLSTVSSRSKSLGKTHLPEPKSKTKDDNKDLPDKEKKSIWSWKGLKSLTNSRHRRFNCCFSLQVHSIEGLPPLFDELSLLVHWKRRDGELVTRPAMVFQGVAEFEEQLLHSCSIYGSRNGPHHSVKYEAKHFLVYASVYGTPELDLGEHRVDLTRLLPLTLEELEEDKSSGKWTTSYRLSGKAKGAILNVSYGYEIIDSKTGHSNEKDVSLLRSSRKNSANTVKLLRQVHRDNELSLIPRAGSLPTRSTVSKLSSEDVKDLHEVLPAKKTELSDSINLLYKKFEEEKLNSLIEPGEAPDDVFVKPIEPTKPDLKFSFDADKENSKDECCIDECSIKDNGAEVPASELEKSMENTETSAHGSAGGSCARNDIIEMVPEDKTLEPSVIEGHEDDLLINEGNFSEAKVYSKEHLLKELDSALNSIPDFDEEELGSGLDENSSNQENHMEYIADDRTPEKGKSHSFGDVTDVVASEFLDFLGIEHSPFGLSSESEPESPRERLLREFEKDVLSNGNSLFNFIDEDGSDMVYRATTESAPVLFPQDYNSHSTVQPSQELPKVEPELMRHRTKASMLEDLETELLMHEWGLNENSFQCSPSNSSGGFGSPVDMPLEIHDQLPSLGEGLGPFLQTENGGFLRSMNPALFRNAKSGGSLIMQVSTPVVMPADMGSGVMDILQHLASVGIEKLSMQANKLMPLDDVTGKTMQQIAWEAAPSSEGPERQDLLAHESKFGQSISSETGRVKGKSSVHKKSKFESNAIGGNKDPEYVSLEDLAPLAMDKIEALAIEGLRIQSGLSDEDAPANISPQSIGEISALEGKMVNSGSSSLGLEGAGGLQLLDIKDNGEDVDGLMALSLTLDEWMKLDSGEIYDGDCISEHTSKLLAAHHASSMDLIRGRSKGEKRRGKGKSCGLLGNNFTVALMVQLRDPLRNYEPVGTPMLALIQVERVFVPPKPRIFSTVSELRNRNYDDDDDPRLEPSKEQQKDEEMIVPEEDHSAQFKITEVHVAGLKTEPGKKKLWGSSTQQQSGSRWLLANGMGKKNKHPFMKSNTSGAKSSLPAASSSETTTVQQQQQPQPPGETLWSLSSSSSSSYQVHDKGANKRKEPAARIPHIRNPNFIFSNGFGKLKLR